MQEDKTALIEKAIAQGGAQHGMQTFDQAIFGLLDQQLVTREEALRWTSSGDAFAAGSGRSNLRDRGPFMVHR